MASGLIAAANFPGHLAGALLATRTLAGSRHAWLLGSLGAINTGIMGGTTALPAFLLLHLAGGVASALALILSSAPVLRTLADARRQDLAALHFAGVGVGIAISGGPVAALQTMDGVPLACDRRGRRAGTSPQTGQPSAGEETWRTKRSAADTADWRIRPVRVRLRHYRDIPGDRASDIINPWRR
jgi:hypothetical protein